MKINKYQLSGLVIAAMTLLTSASVDMDQTSLRGSDDDTARMLAPEKFKVCHKNNKNGKQRTIMATQKKIKKLRNRGDTVTMGECSGGTGTTPKPPPKTSCSPAAYWRFDGKCGSKLVDSVGGFHGIKENALTPTMGQVGKGMGFKRGGPSYMIIGKNSCGTDINDLYTDGEFSMLVWVKAKILSDARPWLLLYGDWGDPTSGNAVHFSLENGYIDLLTSGPGGSKHCTGNTQVAVNKWHHVAVTVKAGKASFYLDGMPDGGGTAAPTISAYTFDPPRKSIGAKGEGYYSFDGVLDEFAIYDCALTAKDVKSLYDHSSIGNPYPTA